MDPKESELAVQPSAGGCRLRLRVKCRAPRDEIIGTYRTALKLAVREAPEGGRANRAICAFLAGVLGVAASSVTIVTGETTQDKSIRIAGVSPEECRRRLQALIG